jgi:hypothetical protein
MGKMAGAGFSADASGLVLRPERLFTRWVLTVASSTRPVLGTG